MTLQPGQEPHPPHQHAEEQFLYISQASAERIARLDSEREVKPHVPDAWIDMGRRDPKDGRVGLVGYEINFNRYFCRYTPPRPLEEIEADIRGVEQDILRMLAEVTGSRMA